MLAVENTVLWPGMIYPAYYACDGVNRYLAPPDDGAVGVASAGGDGETDFDFQRETRLQQLGNEWEVRKVYVEEVERGLAHDAKVRALDEYVNDLKAESQEVYSQLRNEEANKNIDYLAEARELKRCIYASLVKYSENWWEINKQSMKLWVPYNFVNFYFLPTHLRTPFMAFCAVGYTTFFSWQQQQIRNRRPSSTGQTVEANAKKTESGY